MNEIKLLFYWFRWVCKGKPMVKYSGFNCGLCGRWCDAPFEIPEYKSAGSWWDTWGMCKDCETVE